MKNKEKEHALNPEKKESDAIDSNLKSLMKKENNFLKVLFQRKDNKNEIAEIRLPIKKVINRFEYLIRKMQSEIGCPYNPNEIFQLQGYDSKYDFIISHYFWKLIWIQLVEVLAFAEMGKQMRESKERLINKKQSKL